MRSVGRLANRALKRCAEKKSDDVILPVLIKNDSLPKSLTLNNEDRRAPIDYSEMALTRRINRAGGEILY